MLQIRILVVDDQPLLRAGLIQLIDQQGDLVCCGEINSTVAISQVIARLKPNLVLIGLGFQAGRELGLIKSLKVEFPDLPLLVLSHDDDTACAERAWEAGATGYMLKREAAEEVLVGIRTCLKSEKYVSRAASVLVLRKMIGHKPDPSTTTIDKLSNRELHVLQLLGSGLSTRQVAIELGLSSKTVETHRENLKHKLGLRDAPSLIGFATAWAEGLSEAPRREELPKAKQLKAD
jgi:DNA-binding NarL/FixJ family response regulator